ncbi:hypothetical protein LTR37_020850 [Vermiconidia calcicola]|uniref:Uncharacterized protein n=1 Tax=Vermiconidia calcicola TaxID=1690605 RepID=A0ACC3MBZ4_9PEZI|nr:hypothetical protein LTR37_020850 [Vermiconidia calcicola]
MSFSTAYTPLESLLLFQALRSEGVDSHAVFNRISEQLKRISVVRNDPTYDSGRLSPDALRELYLWLLKQEVKEDLQRQLDRESVLQNGDVSPGSRKRKAPSPSLPTVHEASQHSHLIPQLVTRLYTRYREHTVRDILEHERRYTNLVREIGEIEAGQWDDRLRKQQTSSTIQSPRPSSSAHTQPTTSKPDVPQSRKSISGSPTAAEQVGNATSVPSKPYKGNKIGDVMNHGPEPQNESSQHRRTSSNTTLPPLSEMAPQSPRFGIPPKVPGPLSTHLPGNGFNLSPSSGHQSPYAPPHHAHPTPAAPQVQKALSRPSSSPRPILPPPPGMKLPPPSPVQHSASPHLRGPPMPNQQQYPQPPPHRLSTGPSPTNERLPRGFTPQAAQQVHPQAGYYQPHAYPDRRTSYQPQQVQPGYTAQAPHTGGYQLPPFSVDPHAGQQQAMYQQQSPVPLQRPPSYPQQPPQRLVPPANARVVSDIIAALATPPRQQRKSGWKRPSNLQVGTPLPSPQTEPLSPVMKRSEPAARSARTTRQRDPTIPEPSVEPEQLPKSARTRGRPKRERSPLSVVSSTADETARTTRSHSVSTAAGAVATSDDRPSSRGNVKIEPSTPAGFVEVPETAPEVPFAGGRMTRKRRGTLQSQPQPPPKRTRQQSPDHDPEDKGTSPARPSTVVATRNFHKISATIMNDINSHKHASYFANPVRDKDAPGYAEIIRQPQNLKSIRAAINAGTKAVNAATAALDSPSTSGTPTVSAPKATAVDGSTTVELERTADLLPPKAIVNGAQLEKEIMRMFANAVMFNPGEDGMVSDTREMFEDVEAKLSQWRGAEKEAGDGEFEEESKGKRRKL